MMRGWLVAFVLSCGLVVPGLRSPAVAADDLEMTLGLSPSEGTMQPAAISGAPGTPGLPLVRHRRAVAPLLRQHGSCAARLLRPL